MQSKLIAGLRGTESRDDAWGEFPFESPVTTYLPLPQAAAVRVFDAQSKEHPISTSLIVECAFLPRYRRSVSSCSGLESDVADTWVHTSSCFLSTTRGLLRKEL